MKVLNPFVLALAFAVGDAFGASGGPAPNYWCTCATQGATLGRNVTALNRVAANGAVVIPGDVLEKPHGAYTPNVVLETVPPCVDPVAFVSRPKCRGNLIYCI